jgi:hypothetical protein
LYILIGLSRAARRNGWCCLCLEHINLSKQLHQHILYAGKIIGSLGAEALQGSLPNILLLDAGFIKGSGL